MFTMMIMFFISISISIMFIVINMLFSKKNNKNREKSSSFECGFDPISNPRIPFSIHFFLISLMFLIFDIEITLLIPFPSLLNMPNYMFTYSFYFFMFILIISIYIEYLENMLEWKN